MIIFNLPNRRNVVQVYCITRNPTTINRKPACIRKVPGAEMFRGFFVFDEGSLSHHGLLRSSQ